MIVSLLLAVLPALSGCTSSNGPAAPAEEAPAGSAVPAELIAQTWQVRMANAQARSVFEGRPSWVAYFQGKRNEALQNMAGESDAAGLARMHAEYAAMYRQAALIAANATIQVYGADAEPTDPVEVSYLLGVSGLLLKNADYAAKLSGSAVPAAKAWSDWAAAGAVWPPDLAANVAGIQGAPGSVPGADIVLSSYKLQGEDGAVEAGDPAALVALSRWHEAAALAADAASVDAVARLIDPWRLPTEVYAPQGPTPSSDTFLFMSVNTSAGDAAFYSDLARNGVAAVDAHAGDSVYAAVVKGCTKDGKIVVDCVLDESAAVGKAIEAGMEKSAGSVDSFHRLFADFARVGILRAADRAALTTGDTDTSGRLRINALDHTVGNATDPLFLLSVAAWDAGNRNTTRAEEIVHNQLEQVPGLHVARAPLDALHVRLARNTAPGLPMH